MRGAPCLRPPVHPGVQSKSSPSPLLGAWEGAEGPRARLAPSGRCPPRWLWRRLQDTAPTRASVSEAPKLLSWAPEGECAGFGCLQLEIIHMPKWPMWEGPFCALRSPSRTQGQCQPHPKRWQPASACDVGRGAEVSQCPGNMGMSFWATCAVCPLQGCPAPAGFCVRPVPCVRVRDTQP